MDLFAAGHIDKYNLFENQNYPGTYLMIDLKGTISNPNGIGAQVDVWNYGQVVSRNMLPNGGLHDFSNLRLHLGLDGAYSVDSINIFWPSGIIQKFGNTNSNQLLTIVEDTTITRLNRKVFESSVPIKVSPNPATENVQITFILKQPADVAIELENLNGQKMKSVLNKPLKKGDHQLNIPIGDLPNGIYLIKIRAGLNTSIKKLVVY